MLAVLVIIMMFSSSKQKLCAASSRSRCRKWQELGLACFNLFHEKQEPENNNTNAVSVLDTCKTSSSAFLLLHSFQASLHFCFLIWLNCLCIFSVSRLAECPRSKSSSLVTSLASSHHHHSHSFVCDKPRRRHNASQRKRRQRHRSR
jgi:hypothetical protein